MPARPQQTSSPSCSLSETDEAVSSFRYRLQRAESFAVGRALQRGMGKALLGPVNLRVHGGKLRIDSRWGGSEIPVIGQGEVSAKLTARAFCTLITTRFREKAPSGIMTLTFRRAVKEVATDDVGVRAKFKL